MIDFIYFGESVVFPPCPSPSSGHEQGHLKLQRQGGTEWGIGMAGAGINYLFDWFYLFRWECCFSSMCFFLIGSEQGHLKLQGWGGTEWGFRMAGARINYLLNRFYLLRGECSFCSMSMFVMRSWAEPAQMRYWVILSDLQEHRELK